MQFICKCLCVSQNIWFRESSWSIISFHLSIYKN